tara:strand:- start:38 stop:391 length:354 start_codon:yes stop_codon:yes gene_type:complete
MNKLISILFIFISSFLFAQESKPPRAIAKKTVISSDSMSTIMHQSIKLASENITYNPKKLKYKKTYNRNGKILEDGYFIKKELVNGKLYVYGNQYNLIYIQTIKNYIVIKEEKIEPK